MNLPLMPKATAVWLIDNTALTFEQIADFCQMHPLEVQAIADGDVAMNIVGFDPIASQQLTWDEIHRCEQDASAQLQLLTNAEVEKLLNKGSRYVSHAKRGDRPSAIAWIVRNHPTIPDAQIIKLLRTTKQAITSIRERTHKNIQHIQAKNPVTLGLCSEGELNRLIADFEKKEG